MGKLLIFLKLDGTKKTQNVRFKKLLERNFCAKLQTNLYLKHGIDFKQQDNFIKILKQNCPEYSHIKVIWITDDQWKMTHSFFGKSQTKE